MKNPETSKEWQEAVDAAQAMLALNAAREYELITGGPEVDVERCTEILRAGKNRGYIPQEDAIERVVRSLSTLHP